jgi:hypothetical protein
MKSILKIAITSALLIIFIGINISLSAQEPPHPPTSGHGTEGNQPGGGSAPLDGGLGIIIAISLISCGKKMYKLKQNQE